MLWRLAAAIVVVGHAAYMLAVAASWLMPLPWQLALMAVLAGATAMGKRRYRGRCPVTLAEYRLRRRGGQRIRAESLTRRLLLRCVTERQATRIAYGVAAASLALGLLRAITGS